MTDDIEGRVEADGDLIGIIKFVGYLFLILSIACLCILPSDIVNYSFFKTCATLCALIVGIIFILKYFIREKKEVDLDPLQKKKTSFMNTISTQLVYYKNDTQNKNKIVATPENLQKKKNNILMKFVNNLKLNLENKGFYAKKTQIDSLSTKLKSYQLETVELTDNSNNTSNFILNKEEIDESLLNIENGVGIVSSSLLGGSKNSEVVKGKIDKTEINKNNKETLEIMKEKLNLYKYLEGEYKIKVISDMKDDIFMCSFAVYGDIIILTYINSNNEIVRIVDGRLVENTEDNSKIDMMNDTKLYATFKRMGNNIWDVEVNQRDFKKIEQDQMKQITSLLQEDILFKDLTKIIDISKDHKYIQEYNLLDYLIEYKRIKKISNLSDEKIILESLISNIVLLIDSLKKSEYDKTNYSNIKKQGILLNAQKWFNNFKNIEEIYNLLIKLKKYNNSLNKTENETKKIGDEIIVSLTKIKQTKQGIKQLKLQRHKIIFEIINTIILNEGNLLEDKLEKIKDLIKF